MISAAARRANLPSKGSRLWRENLPAKGSDMLENPNKFKIKLIFKDNNSVFTNIYLRRVKQRAARNQGIETPPSPVRMDWLEPKPSFPKETRIITTSDYNTVNFQAVNLCTATTKEQHDRVLQRIDTTEHHEGAHKTTLQSSNTTEHHEGAPQRRARNQTVSGQRSTGMNH